MSTANIIVPSAPAFLDPLIEIESCYYYSVPRFYSFHHPNTRWLIAMIKTREEDRVKRKMELNPELFKGKYFQMMDYPKLYLPQDPSVTPMFKRQSVLYLSALGMSIYLRSMPLIDLILFHKDPYEQVVGNPYEPQFASHLQDMKYGDFHAFPPCVIMLRMYCFECTVSLLQAGWNPTQPLALPMRRKFERRAFYFYDWLEAALGLLSERPLYPLQSLILNMTRNMTMYKYLTLPLTHMLPPTPKHRVPTGLIDVEELPVGTRMIGVRSLLEMAEDYDRYLQMRSCAVEVAALKREAAAVGLNPEILMIQALDFDGYVAEKEAAQESGNNAAHWRGGGIGSSDIPGRHWSVEHDTRQAVLAAVNANNSATDAPLNANASASKKKKKNVNYASEGCRVMHYAMDKDKTCKRMQVCLDALIVMTKRGFYINGERLPADTPRARDIRNIVVLLLNMIQREQEKLDVIFAKIQSGYKKFQHLEEHKLLENRRLASVYNISKMIAALTRILLHSKELVYFVSSIFPPFPSNTIDIAINHRLQTKFNEIKGGVVQEFNSIKDGWTYLSKEMMLEVANIKAMQLHFRVGTQPTPAAIIEAKKAARKSAMRGKSKNKNNMSNTNSCFVTFRKVQRVSAKKGAARGRGGIGRALAGACDQFDDLRPSEDNHHLGACGDTFYDDEEVEASATAAPAAVSPLELCSPSTISQLDWESLTSPAGAAGAGAAAATATGAGPAATTTVTDTIPRSDDPALLGDIFGGGDGGGLSETDLLMSSLCKEVQDLLRPKNSATGLSSAGTGAFASTQSKSTDDIATIEPEPGTQESCSRGTTPDQLHNQYSRHSSTYKQQLPLLQKEFSLFD